MKFEVCANSVASCIAARDGGAHRVELCAGIPEGGTTPSYGEVITAREITGIKLHVIIRPRGGDFLYSSTEINIMLKDIELMNKARVDGVVFGCLTPEGDVDKSIMKELISAAKGMSVTFHRAFDVCRDPYTALEEIIDLGCDRILTSGQASTAEKGIPLLQKLNEQAADRITLMAGCGVNKDNIHRIAQETNIKEFHFSAREMMKSRMIYRNQNVSMGGTISIDEYSYPETTADKVKQIIKAAKGL